MNHLDLAMYCLMNYPIGTKVYLKPDGDEHIVNGVKFSGNTPCISFSDGSSLCLTRTELIEKMTF